MIGAVGVMLGLQAEALALAVDAAGGAGVDALQGVAAVQLHGGHVGEHVHHAAGGGVGDLGGEAQAGLEVVDVEVVVDAQGFGSVSKHRGFSHHHGAPNGNQQEAKGDESNRLE